MENLERMRRAVGREHLVLDVSCRKKNDVYYVVTDRWQKFTNEIVNSAILNMLAEYCDEFLIHAVDVEGKNQGIEQPLVEQLGRWSSAGGRTPITYAGGVHSYEDIDLLKRLGNNQINVTIGSALELFGGTLLFDEVLQRVSV